MKYIRVIKIINYLQFKLDHTWFWNSFILNNADISKEIIIKHGIVHHSSLMTRDANDPSALHIIVPNFFPTDIQSLESFKNLNHYFSRLGSRLAQVNKQISYR